MNRGLVLCFAAMLFASSVKQGMADAKPRVVTSAELIQLLDRPLEAKTLEIDNEMNLKEFTTKITGHFHQLGFSIDIRIDTAAFRKEDENLDILDCRIKFAPILEKISLRTLLALALPKIPTEKAVYLIRDGDIVVTTKAAGSPAALLRQPIYIAFENVKLRDAVHQLADKTGATIFLDPGLDDNAPAVTATIRGNLPLESAVRLLAEMAEAQADVEDDILVVRPRVKVDKEKSAFEFKHRRLDSALQELAKRSGQSIVLDPRIVTRIRRLDEGGTKPRRPQPVRLAPVDFTEEPELDRYRVTATFTSKTPVASMVQVLATMAHLQVVTLQECLYVTDDEGALRLQRSAGDGGKK